MLVLLSVDDIKSRRGLMRLLCPHTPPTPIQYFVTVNSIECMLICAKRLNGRIRWDLIRGAVGDAPIIMAKDINPPKGINRHSSEKFLIRVMFNTASEMLLGSEIPISRRRVAVVDPTGEWAQLTSGLINLAGTVRVHTQNRKLYESYSNICYREQGAQMIVTADSLWQHNFDFALCPFGAEGRGEPAIITKDGWFYLDPESVRVAGISSAVKGIVSPIDFISAVYEYEDRHRLGFLSAEYLVHNGYKVFIKELIG